MPVWFVLYLLLTYFFVDSMNNDVIFYVLQYAKFKEKAIPGPLRAVVTKEKV